MATEKTFLDDPTSLKELIEAMPSDVRDEYKSYKSLQLESAFPGRKMVVYTIKNQQPIDIEVITFGAFMCDWDMGPSTEVAVSGGKTQLIAVPKKLTPRDVFMHIPQTFQLKYKGRRDPQFKVDFVSHYAVLVKTRSKDTHKVEGDTYCVTLNKFRESFPDLKFKY